MAAANDLRKGMCIRYNSNPAIVLEVQHRTPGNLRAFVQCIIRYIGTGKSADVRFGSTDKIDLVDVQRSKLEFSYKDHQGFHFMDPESYETISFDNDFIGDAKDYLTENQSVEILYVEGKPASLDLPSQVTLKVNKEPRDTKDSREVTVEPIGDEAPLYYHQWVQANIKKVSDATDAIANREKRAVMVAARSAWRRKATRRYGKPPTHAPPAA